MALTVAPHVLRPLAERLSLLWAATLHASQVACMSARQMQKLLGHWVWTFMTCRLGLSILSTCYQFVHAHLDDPLHLRPMRSLVRDELVTLCALTPLFFTNLERPWGARAFMTDASMEGYGIVATPATKAECREAHVRRWPKDAAEEFSFAQENDEEEEARRWFGLPSPEEDAANRPSSRSFGDVFGGEGGLGSAVSAALGCKSVNIDTAVSWRYDLTSRRRVRRLAGDIRRGVFFMLHFAPPCETWRRARILRLRKAGVWIEGLPSLKMAAQRQLEAPHGGNDRTEEPSGRVRCCVV